MSRERKVSAKAEIRGDRFKDLVESLDAIVWEADARTLQFTFVSNRAETILGYPIEQWLAEPSFWADHLHPDDREGTVAACKKAASEALDHELEYRMVAADGRAVWLRDLVRVVPGGDGRPAILRGVMVNTTEQKRVEEEHFRLISA